MMLLSVVLGLLVIGLVLVGQKLAQKMAAQQKQAAARPAGAASHAPHAAFAASASLPPEPAAEEVPVAQHYRSDKVGNDSAARPWDHGASAWSEPAAFSSAAQAGTADAHSSVSASSAYPAAGAGLALRPDQLPDRVPAHFDLALLLERSKDAFLRLHRAWEQADASAVRELLVPAIWQQVESAMQVQALPEWGQRVGEVQHLAARALEAQPCEGGRVRVRMEFTGSQWHAADEKVRPIHEVWEVRYHEQPLQWQIADLHSRERAA